LNIAEKFRTPVYVYDAEKIVHQYNNLKNAFRNKKVKLHFAMKLYSVVGYICESDTLGYDRLLNEVREGDILAIHNAGAYGFSMSNQYNARLRPAEVLLHDGKALLIRKRETLEDLYRNEVELDLY
jgi:diaminopimelate decarboxylase